MNHTNNNQFASYRLAAFAAPSFVTSLIYGPVFGVLPALIVMNFGVELATMSTLLLIVRLFDGVTDPVVGILSDRTRTSIGRRKPWIIAGYLILLLAVYRLFMPPSDADAVYFLIWMTALVFGWTVAEVPYSAWISEITRESNIRIKIQTYRQCAILTGSLFVAAGPLLPIFASTEMTYEVLGFIGKVILLVMPPAVCASLMLNQEGKRIAVKEALSLKDLAASVKANRPFQLYIIIFSLFGLSMGMIAVLTFPILDSFLGIGDKYSYLLFGSVFGALFSMPLWLKIIARIGKHRSLVICGLLAIAIHSTFLLITPGPGSFIPYLFILIGGNMAFQAFYIIPLPMLADVIDYDILKTGTNRAAQYTATYTLILKCSMAVSSALSYFLLSWFGFDISSKVHSPSQISGLYATYVYIPMAIALIGVVLAWFFPIDERRHKIILARIEKRAKRKAKLNES